MTREIDAAFILTTQNSPTLYAQICLLNALKPMTAGALPNTPLDELTTSLRPSKYFQGEGTLFNNKMFAEHTLCMVYPSMVNISTRTA
jgi:hypothetical protein